MIIFLFELLLNMIFESNILFQSAYIAVKVDKRENHFMYILIPDSLIEKIE
ncbi:Uncharacterised protein [Mycobacteroides abscessus subsp. abscessus]|nr:Uncharacterised protein [Mycobacteroides abscessus subsp. abscessus]